MHSSLTLRRHCGLFLSLSLHVSAWFDGIPKTTGVYVPVRKYRWNVWFSRPCLAWSTSPRAAKTGMPIPILYRRCNLIVEAVARERRRGSTRENEILVKLLDLGLALFGAAREVVDELTTVGQLMGTLD